VRRNNTNAFLKVNGQYVDLREQTCSCHPLRVELIAPDSQRQMPDTRGTINIIKEQFKQKQKGTIENRCQVRAMEHP